MRSGLPSPTMAFSSTTTLLTFSMVGRSNMMSSSTCSMIERKPRAPVFRARALLAIACSACGRTSRSTPSMPNSFWYCLMRAFFGSVSIWISACSSSSSSVATTGSRPTNSGISPYLIRSSGSTVRKISLMSLPFVRSLKNGKDISEILRTVEPEDLIKYGLIPEFVGRLPVVATLEELDEQALIQILTEPKNALIKQYQKLFGMEGVDLEVRPQALQAIAKKALARKTGARGLRSILEQVLLDLMFDLPTMENVSKVVVDENTIIGESKPLLIYTEPPKVAGTA